MSLKKKSFTGAIRNILLRNVLMSNVNSSLEWGSKSDIKKNLNLLSHDESKALWIKINQTLQIIH